MGNRAYIIGYAMYQELMAGDRDNIPALQVSRYDKNKCQQWLRTCEERGCTPISRDAECGLARLCQVACESNPDGLDIGITALDKGFVRYCIPSLGSVVLIDGFAIADTH